jgi:hypothetical protein
VFQVTEAEQAFAHIQKLDAKSKTRSMVAYRFRAHMQQCCGQHAGAVDTLTKALAPLNGKSPSDQRIECLYLRGALPVPKRMTPHKSAAALPVRDCLLVICWWRLLISKYGCMNTILPCIDHHTCCQVDDSCSTHVRPCKACSCSSSQGTGSSHFTVELQAWGCSPQEIVALTMLVTSEHHST